MRRASAGILSAFRGATKIFTLAVLAATVAGATAGHANPKYAAIVIDANTGKTLHASSADEARFPASLTKMMTLYMVFEAMEAGKINANTRVQFSAQAAAKPPTKIGVRAGGSITVEQAILSLVTKSANDAATAVGEMLGGSEENFARMMTAKARRLGMASTTFRNASGLPDSGQRTTARDMATLGIALREHFPRQYHYFSTRSFTLGKTRMGNHNKLLGRVRGVDGIKTGYIRASGFNLVSSVSDNGRKIVAVVMGGRSGASRDAHMAELIKANLPKASQRGGEPLIASRTIDPRAASVAAVHSLPKRGAPVPDGRPGETVEEVAIAAYAPTRQIDPDPTVQPATRPSAEIDTMQTASTPPAGSWVIQVGSLRSEPEAMAMLAKTAEKAPRLLSNAAGFTEVFDHGGATYYRARFAGFGSKSAAWNACGALKKQNIACYAVQR